MPARYKAFCCGDVIESKSQHDFVRCSCKRSFVDGGGAYSRVGWTDPDRPPEMIPRGQCEKNDCYPLTPHDLLDCSKGPPVWRKNGTSKR